MGELVGGAGAAAGGWGVTGTWILFGRICREQVGHQVVSKAISILLSSV